MKTNRKTLRRLAASLLCAALLAGLLAVPVSAAGDPDIVIGPALTIQSWYGERAIPTNSYMAATLGDGTYFISGTYQQSMSANQAVLTVLAGKTADVILGGGVIDVSGSDGACAFAVEPGGALRLTLEDGDVNTLTSGADRAGLEVPAGAALTITGDGAGAGRLVATGGQNGAGIGGSLGSAVGGADAGGTITITGGTVTATGGVAGVGIGGSRVVGGVEVGASVTITGGTVEAAGGDGSGLGAGIGGAADAAGGTIAITGGTVTATSVGLAAGIGGGYIGDGGDVTISGAATTVTAEGGYYDVGGGEMGSGGSLSVSGGAALNLASRGTNADLDPAQGHGLGACTVTDASIAGLDGGWKGNLSGTYSALTVSGGTASFTDPRSAYWNRGALPGAQVTATATISNFQSWTASGITLPDPTANPVTFTMPGSAVALTANAPPPPSGDSNDGPSFTDEALRAIEKARDGDTVKLNLPGTGTLDGAILEAAAGRDVTLEITAGTGVTWIIRGLDIPTGKLADLNLRVNTKADAIPVTVINRLTGEKKVMQLELRHNGPFGFPLTLRLDVGKENAGLYANLYRYDEAAEALDYQAAAKIGADGSADLPFSRASSYAVVIDDVSRAPVNPFADVAEDDWFYDSVQFVFQRGLMNGAAETAFHPGSPVTRGMAATVLYRLAGNPQDAGEGSAFPDIPDSAYCADAVRWAASAGLVSGYAGGAFRPNDPVTRQALAAMLYRYARYRGMDVSAGDNTNILSYADAQEVSEWAVPAFQWTCGAGVLTGTADNRLAPRAGATRAQLAAVLTRLAGK